MGLPVEIVGFFLELAPAEDGGQQVNGRASSQLRGPSSFRIVWGTKFFR